MPLSRRAAMPLALLLLVSLLGTSALAAPLTTLLAQYVATPPAAVGAGATFQVSVQLTNTGTDAWNAGGVAPVDLAYHWYDAGGSAVVWDGVRTALGADVPAGGQRTVTATVVAPASAGAYGLRFALVKEGVAWFAPGPSAAVTVQPAVYGAGYAFPSSPPSSVAAGGSVAVAVTLTNTGNQTWNASGPSPVDLAYHWYDASGNVVIWDGARTPLGADVAPNAQASVSASVSAPSAPGAYTLRLAVVKEGVAWLAPSSPLALTAVTAYVAAFGPPALPSFLAGGTYGVSVTVNNAGAATWTAGGANPVTLGYHWLDASGNAVVWDGTRARLAADVPPGATATLTASVTAPMTAGSYTLVLDMVREGVSWFAGLGSTPYRAPAAVAAARYAASYAFGATLAAYWGEQKTLQVTVTNTGNVPWNAAGVNPVDLAYHVYDASGNVVVWDGVRAPLATDVAPNTSATLTLTLTAPTATGTYTIAVDMVREGVGWFSQMGVPTAKLPLAVTSGLNAGYGVTSTPSQVTIGAVINLSVEVDNFGPRTWPAGGANPVRLGYHIYGANTGTLYVWDGARGNLPSDVPASSSAVVPVTVSVPSGLGDYVLVWDLVQEGVAWFSSLGIAPKREAFTIVSGVVFYGSGFGHGVGLSQYGAQGLATGAYGPAQTGEQIIQHYFPGSAFQFGDVTRPYNRVLLSQPSSRSAYVCGLNQYFDGSTGDVVSTAGFTVYDETTSPATVIGTAAANAGWRFVASGGVVSVYDNSTGTPRLVKQVASADYMRWIRVEPASGGILRFVQKTQPDGNPMAGYYRGGFRFTNLGDTLRVVNFLTYDDYTRGVIAREMPNTWAPEALKAQAYAARSYGYASYRGTDVDYDVSDDQGSQCYGGVDAEYPSTSAAVAATAGKLVTYGGVIVKTYFSSSNGGYSLDFGCWGTRVVPSGGTWTCSPNSSPPLVAVADPADRLVASPANPRASWSVTFTSTQIQNAVVCAGGPNIGTLLGVDVSNQAPAGVGHVISVRVVGSAATADVKAETLLRGCLGLRSTMVRLSPF